MKSILNKHILKDSILTRKLFLILILISIIPSILILFLYYTLCSQITYKNAQTYSKECLSQAFANVSNIVDDVESSSFSLTINDSVIDLLSSGQLSVGFPNRTELRKILSSALTQNRNTIDIVYLETPKDVIYDLYYSVVKQPNILKITGTPYENLVISKRGNAYWSGIVDTSSPEKSSNIKYLRCISLITGASSTENLGYLSLFVRTGVFDKALKNIFTPIDDIQIVLLDGSDSIISSNCKISSELAEIIDSTDSFPNESEIEINKNKYFVSQVINQDTGWRLISAVSKADATKEIRQLNKLILIPLFLFPFICLILTGLIMKYIYKSLAPLIDSMKKISGGNLEDRVPLVADSVVDSISLTMNDMLDKYSDVVSINAHQEALLITSRLEILKGQLSPHFLYNTLDCINWKLIEDGYEEASNVVSSLGNILRYSIDESTSTVPLKKELNIIEQYLSICKFRFESQLNYNIECCKELISYQIPRFLLQPIVENAIVHGMDDRKDSISINVVCRVEKDYTVIDVTNSGFPIENSVIETLYSSFNEPDIRSEHIGLSNVYHRIKLFYGENYGLSIQNLDTHGVLVRVKLPIPNGDVK